MFDWIAPSGGSYGDPQNWSPLGPPTFDSTIRFDLSAAYLVTTESIIVSETMIGRDEVSIDAYLPGKGSGFIEFGTLWIGGGTYGVPRDIDAPGRLTLVGESYSSADDIVLGSGMLASQLVLASATELQSVDLMMTPASSLRYRLDDTTTTLFPIIELIDSAGTNLNGALQLGVSDDGATPYLGERFRLLGTPGFIDTQSFPFVGLAPRPGRTFELEWIQTKRGAEILATIAVSDTVAEFNLSETDDLAESPNRLVAADLDQDGRDDLVVLLPSGVARLYPSGASGFEPPIDYEVGDNPIDAATGDFDADGTIDLAIGCRGSSTLEYLLNPLDDVSQLQPGPIESIGGDIRSLARTVFVPGGPELIGNTGVSVTLSTGFGGKTRGYTTDGASVVQVAEIEVGDDPGPSDPIDDENKKDPDPPIGVGGLGAAGFGKTLTPILTVIDPAPTASGYEILATIPLTGVAVDLASGDLDADGVLDTLVVTDNGHLDLLRAGVPEWPVHSIHLDGTPTSIAMGDLDGDARPEVVIGLADPARLELHRVVNVPQAQGIQGRLILERYSTEYLSQVPVDVVVASAPGGPTDSEVVVGLEGDGGGGAPAVNVNQVETTKTPDCVYADFNGDGEISGFDIAYILGWWGPCQSDDCPFDLDGDGIVGSSDLGLLMTGWGECLP